MKTHHQGNLPADSADVALRLAAQLGEALLRRGGWLACAESCTGGLLAGTLTEVAGASQWFERGFVTYSNAAKQADLGVSTDILSRYGAVSAETANAMAAGVLTTVPVAGLSLATTGIAGPGGGTPEKPVGLVWFGVGWRDADGRIHTRAQSHLFNGDRAGIRRASVALALRLGLAALETPEGLGKR